MKKRDATEPIRDREAFLAKYPSFLADSRTGIERFEGIDRREVLDRILPVAELVSFESGSMLLEQGKPNFFLYILLKGKLNVEVDDRLVVQLKRCGDIMGEISFVSGSVSYSSVIAAEDTELLMLDFSNVSDIADLKNLLLKCLANKVTWTSKVKTESDYISEAISTRTINELEDERTIRRELEEANQVIKKQNRALIELNRRFSERTKELEKALGSEKAFLNNLSHELKTPLHHILGSVSLLKKSSLEAVQTGYAEQIKHAGESLLLYLNRLLELSYLYKTSFRLNTRKVRFCDFLAKTSQVLEKRAAGRQITIVYRMDDEGSHVNIDETQLFKVMNELVDNAGKYAPGVSTITITTGSTADSVICSVIDNGIGVPADELKLIFQSFKLSSKTDDGARGKGIGLSIAGRIIELHGGTIWAENNVESGLTISFSIPKTK